MSSSLFPLSKSTDSQFIRQKVQGQDIERAETTAQNDEWQTELRCRRLATSETSVQSSARSAASTAAVN